MKNFYTILFVTLMSSLSANGAGSKLEKSSSKVENPPVSSQISQEYLVAFANEISSAERQSLWAKFPEVREKEKVGSSPLYLIQIQTENHKAIADKIARESGIRYVEPNLKMRMFPKKTNE
jgi:hypothetical protein